MSSSSFGVPEPAAPPPAGADPDSWVLRAPATRGSKVAAFILSAFVLLIAGMPALTLVPVVVMELWPGPRWVHLLVAGLVVILTLSVVSWAVHLVRQVVAAFGAHTVVGRDGLETHPVGGPVLVKWPESRSGLFAQAVELRVGPRATVVVRGWAVTPEGGCRHLTGLVRSGLVSQHRAVLREVEVELDAIWRWGLRHGAVTESGRYIPLRNRVREQVRQIDRAGDRPSYLPPGVGPLDQPSVPVASGSNEKRLVVETGDHQGFIWTEFQWWLLALGWLMSIPLAVALLVATWRVVMAGDRALLPLWIVLVLLCLAAVVGEVLAAWLLVRAASRRTRRTVATVSGIEVDTLTGVRVVPWPESRAALTPRAGRLGSRSWTVDAWLTSPQGESFRLAGICVRGPGPQRDIAVEEVNARLDLLWEWGLSHGAVSADGSRMASS